MNGVMAGNIMRTRLNAFLLVKIRAYTLYDRFTQPHLKIEDSGFEWFCVSLKSSLLLLLNIYN